MLLKSNSWSCTCACIHIYTHIHAHHEMHGQWRPDKKFELPKQQTTGICFYFFHCAAEGKVHAGLYPLSLKVTSIFQGCLNVHTVVFPSCIRPASRMNAEAITDCFADLGHSHHDGATGWVTWVPQCLAAAVSSKETAWFLCQMKG